MVGLLHWFDKSDSDDHVMNAHLTIKDTSSESAVDLDRKEEVALDSSELLVPVAIKVWLMIL